MREFLWPALIIGAIILILAAAVTLGYAIGARP